MEGIEENYPRPNLKYIIGSSDTSGGGASGDDGFCNSNDTMESESSTYKPAASSRSYVDETIHFSSLENSNLSFNNVGMDSMPTTNIDSKYLPLDENYKSCTSVLGSGNENARNSAENAQKDKTTENLISKAKIITVMQRYLY